MKKQDKKIPEELKEKFKEIKTKLDKLKKGILASYSKEVTGIALLPPEKEAKKSINVLILINDLVLKEPKHEAIEKLIKDVNKIAKNIDEKLKPRILPNSELVENCYDGKYEILQLIAASAPIYDPADMLAALKIAEVHKSMTIKKFEKYVLSYVAAGSLFRGEKAGDIDVYVVIDDTDVKKMSRMELRDKLRAIISSIGFDAAKITGVNKLFHVQTYILTDFWEAIKEASPVIFTFLRDGVPLFDRGVFMPWKILLRMGRIKPSPEAIDMHMNIGEKLIDRAKAKLLSVVGEDIFYATLNPAQAALMLYGIPPPTPKETIKLIEEIFVNKEKLLEKRYVDILDKVRKMYKDVEHNKIKEISGKEIDDLLKDVDDYLKRIKVLFKELEKRSGGTAVLEFYDACTSIAKNILKLEDMELDNIEKGFAKLAKEGKIPERFLKIIKAVIKAKGDFEAKKLTKQEVEKVRKEANIFIRAMLEYMQRKRGVELERAKMRIKYGDKFGEVYLLNDLAFIIEDIDAKEKEVNKAKLLPEGGLGELKKSNLTELEEHIAKAKIPKHVFIKEKIFEDLKKLFGKDVKILISY